MKIYTKITGLQPDFYGWFKVKYEDFGDIKTAAFRSVADAISFIDDNTIKATPAPGASDFNTILTSLGEVLTEKNKRYGNSALNPLKVFGGKSKVGQRADDKLSRIQNSVPLRKNDVADLLGYLVLICKENNWTDFSDQID